MNSVYLILGGNIGNKLENLERTRELITRTVGPITKKSDIFVTAAWGKTDQPDFYNQALHIETELEAAELLKQLLEIEAANGRIRDGQKWSERTMDIDILFYNNAVIDESQLKVPHPHMHERRFVLAPLAQIAGEYMHPLLKKSVKELLHECKDTSGIRILESTY